MDVEFLQMPCSLSSGEYPLLSSKTQSLAGHTKATYNMRVVEDLRQKIKVPAFSGWSDCNMIRMGGNLYWILEANTATDSEASVEMIVSYCGPSSIIHKGDNIVGTFSRLPTNKCPYLQRQAVTSALEHTRTVTLPHITDYGTYSVFWLQATALTTGGNYIRRGYFVAVGSDGSTDYRLHCNFYDESAPIAEYPSLHDIMTEPETYIGATASQIVDISISHRCPWNVYQVSYFYMLKSDETTVGYLYPSVSVGDYKAYDLDGIYSNVSNPVPYTATISITLADLERASGTITIRDENCAAVGTIPCAYGATVSASLSMISDYTGITTYLDYGGYRVTIPEGHVPWSGTSWAEYRAYSMAYDRQAMNNSINFSNERVAVGLAQSAASTIQSAAMGFIGGDMTGGVAGIVGGATSYAISAWATQKESDISTREAQATQKLAERRVAGQPATPYNAGYGLIYCQQCQRTPASIWVEMPANLTESVDQDYTTCYGFPAEGLRSITVQEGYIKGRIYDNGVTRGPRFDRMNEALQNGILFKEI